SDTSLVYYANKKWNLVSGGGDITGVLRFQDTGIVVVTPSQMMDSILANISSQWNTVSSGISNNDSNVGIRINDPKARLHIRSLPETNDGIRLSNYEDTTRHFYIKTNNSSNRAEMGYYNGNAG